MKNFFKSFLVVTATILLLLFTHVTARSQSFDFDGVDDIATTSGVITGQLDNFTLESWVYPTAYYSYGWTVSESNKYIGLGYNGSGTLTYLINNSTGSAAGVIVPLNTWTHIALVRRNGTYELYKNGVAYSTGQGAAPSGNSGNWKIGFVSSASESVKGAIDEVRIWNVARTATDIANNYTAGISTSAGLVASYRNNAGTPNANNTAITTLTDYSGNGRTATLTNTARTGNTSNFVSDFAGPNVSFTDGSTYPVSPTAGQTNQVIGRFALAANTTGGSITAASIKVTSVPTGYTNFKLWESSDAAFGGDVQLGSTVAAYPGSGSSLAYSAFSSTLTTGTKYYFLTADLAASVSGGVIPLIVSNNSFTFSNALLTGTVANAALMQNDAALDFDGIDDYTTVNGVIAGVVNNFTLESWVYPRAYYSYGWTISENASKYIGLGYSSNGTLTYLINNGTGQAAGVMVPLNTWTHIALVRRNGTYELYKNGVACTTGQSAAPSGNSGNWKIGFVSSASESVKGAIDEVRIWNEARSAGDIAANYNSSLATIPATLMAYYKMSDGIANQNNSSGIVDLKDFSGNGKTSNMYSFTESGTTSNFVPNVFSGTTPAISSFTPTTATLGTTVTITGTNFTGAMSVSFGGTPASSFTVNSATQITATVGAGTSGSVSVSIPGSTATLAGFTYTSQIDVTATLGTATGAYSNLKAAFDAINAGTHKGVIAIKVNGNTTEAASAVLNASAATSSSSPYYTSVNVYPTATGLSISGNLPSPLIDLSGADNVTIDGRVNATGATKDLVITNTSAALASTIRFINDATANTVKYCTLKGSSLDGTTGVLFFSTTTGTTGNDGNTIDNNNITNSSDAARPLNAVYSNGTAVKTNSGNTISNNNIYNFLNKSNSSNGIQLNAYNTGWTISGNSFYETASFAPLASVGYYPILVNQTTTTDIAITGNFIGGSAPLCGGTAWTKTGASYTNAFKAIAINVGPTVTTTTSIQGNTIRNFNWTDNASSSWYAIYANGTGNINIGTITGNTIGATTGTGSIVVTASANSGSVMAIGTDGTGTMNCQNNSIGAITCANTYSTVGTNFYGINKSGAGTTTISNNLIGSNSTANSIICSSLSTQAGQYMYGIYSGGSGAVTISGNTLSKLTNNNNYGSYGHIKGITTVSGTNVITNNTIKDLTVTTSNTTDVILGIDQSSTTAAAQTVSGNTIYNLSNTYATCTGTIHGIYYAGPATASAVSGNFIHSLKVTGNSGATAVGITITAGTTTYSNNIISLGGNTTTSLYGIRETAGTNNYYFNTLYIGGVSPGAGGESDCIRTMSSLTRNFKNNLFVNTRTGATQYGLVLTNTGGVTIDYNDYYVTSGNLAWYNGTVAYTLTALKAASGQDSHSINTNPLFASAGGTTAANYLPASQALTGVSGTGITTDYAGTTRTYNSMGAYDYSVSGLVAVTATLGTATGAYANLKSAFDAINAGTHKGVVAIKVNGSTSEGASAVLNASALLSSGSPYYTSVNVYPTATGLSISGNLPSPLIDLNGADNVTIDGRVNATGATKDLIITNTNTSATAGTSTFRFINNASTNTVKYCTIQGSTTDVSAGVLFFSTTTGTTGNDGNTIDNNNITNSLDANRPLRVVLSYGTIAKTNSGNTISNNNIYNFLNKATASSGIFLSGYNTGWTISGNSFYETASFAPTVSVEYVPINVPSVSSSDITISGNFIGGSAPLCGGTAWTKTNAATNSFKGIHLVNGPTVSTNTSVQGNTIKNMAWSDAGTSDWYGIYAPTSATGDINIGTISGNTIGAATGTGSIVVTSSTANGYVYVISFNGTGTINCQNNTIGAITVANTNNTYPSHFYGILKSGAGTTNISNNLIGSTSTANSIICSSVSGSYPQYLSGIYQLGTGTVTISGNTISKLTNNNNVTAGGFIKGIYTHTGTNIITNNTIRDLTTPNFYAGAGSSSTIIGIAQISTTAAAQTISGNTIYNLSNTNASFAGSITGIYYTGTATASTVSGNFIHSLTASGNTGSGMGAILSGIYIDAGTTTYSNNIVSLGGNTGNTLFGIYDNGGTNNYYFNTLYIGGTPTTGSNASYNLYRSYTNTINCRNNLIITTRSNAGSAAGSHIAASFIYTANLTTDYNNYFATGTGSLLGWWAASKTTLAQIQAVGQDAHSINTDPAFASAGGTLAVNYQVPVASVLPGITIAGQTADYAGITRAATPTIGAYEKSIFSQVVTFTAITAKTYGDADFTPTVTASSGLTTFTYTSSNTAVATVNSSTGLVHIVGAGMANITATQAGNATWAAASASSSLTVNAKALTLASAVAQNKSYDGTNAAVLTGTLTGVINSDDVTVSKTGTFASIAMGTGIAVTSTSTLGGTKAGNYSLTQPTGLTANITGGVQAITFAALAAKTYGDAPFIVSATGGASGNPVTFSSSDPSIASCTGANGTTVTILKAGSCTIYADQAGDVNYAAATQVPQTLTINKADQVITLSPLPVGSVSLYAFGSPIQVTATSNSGLTVAISLGAGSAATLNELNQLVSVGSTGTVVINLAVAGNDNYNAANSSYTFDVVKSNQTITFGALLGATYTSGLTVELSGSASASSTLAVSYTVVSGPASITGTTLNVLGAGDIVIAASQAGDDSWNPAADVEQTLSVAQATQTITFAALAVKNYGDAPFTLSATGDASGNAVTFSSSDPTVATCDGTNGATVTILKAGSCVIYANQAGNTTYTAAAQVSQSLTVNKGDQTLTMSQLPIGNQPLKDFTDPIQVTASSTSGLTVTISLGSGSAAALNGSNQLINIGQTGTVVVNLTQDGDANYNAATASYTFDVVKSNQTISFSALADKTFGDADYSPGSTTSSALAVTYSSSNTAVATIVSNQIHIVGAGTTTITASQSGDATWYAASDVSQSLLVNQATQSITFGTLATKTIGDADYAPGATSLTSGINAITYTSSNTAVATIVGGQIHIVGIGSTDITASQATSTGYSAAADVIQLLTVNQATQAITFGALAAKTYGTADFAPGATSATSGINAITYASSNTAVATIVSGQIHIVGAGTCNITASQAASTNFSAAADVVQSLTVNAKALTISGAAAENKPYDGTNTAVITGTLSGVINSDNVTLTLSGTFAGVNAANGIAVTSTSTLGGTKAGNYTLTQPSGLAANITTVTLTAIADNKSKLKGQSNPAFTISYSGFANNESSGNISVLPVASCSATTGSNAGTYDIIPAGGSDVNYSFNYVNGTLTITNPGFNWTGLVSTDWNTAGNWSTSAVPTASSDVAISSAPANQPHVTVTGSTLAVCNTMTIGAGAVLTIDAGKALTISGDLVNNGILNIESNSGGTGSMITNGSISGSGTANINQYVTNARWHLVSSPVAEATANIFLDDYLQSWSEPNAKWTDIVSPSAALNPLEGYGLWTVQATDHVYTFSGTPNTGNLSKAITYTNLPASENDGASLLGNPYPSSIDWDGLDDTYGAVYYWEGSGNIGDGNYKTWLNNIGSGSKYIPPMQGFFIVSDAAGTFSLSNSDRVHSNAPLYKSSAAANDIMLVLETVSRSISDKLYLKFDPLAEAGFELRNDAYKFVGNINGISQLYSFAGDKKLSIDVRPSCDVVELGFTNTLAGEYKIGVSEVNGFGEAILEDTKTGIFTDLLYKTYTFDYVPGETDHRFNLHFGYLSVTEKEISAANIYSYRETAYINLNNQVKGDIFIYNMAGQLVATKLSAKGMNEIKLNSIGNYIVKVVTDKTAQVKKIFIQ